MTTMRARLVRRRGVTEVVAVVACVGIVGFLAWGWIAVAIVGGLAPAALAADTDRRSGHIPDPLLLATVTVCVAVASLGSLLVGRDLARPVAWAMLVTSAPVAVVHLCSPHTVGFGDVKLSAALGAVVGLVDDELGLAAVAVGVATTAVAAIRWRQREIAFAPGLVFGAATVIMVAATTGSEMLPWH